jgi:hypothetical protein
MRGMAALQPRRPLSLVFGRAILDGEVKVRGVWVPDADEPTVVHAPVPNRDA